MEPDQCTWKTKQKPLMEFSRKLRLKLGFILLNHFIHFLVKSMEYYMLKIKGKAHEHDKQANLNLFCINRKSCWILVTVLIGSSIPFRWYTWARLIVNVIYAWESSNGITWNHSPIKNLSPVVFGTYAKKYCSHDALWRQNITWLLGKIYKQEYGWVERKLTHSIRPVSSFKHMTV